jgi:hypothetical protein
MIKRFGTLAAALALAAAAVPTLLSAPASAAACPTGVSGTTCATANFSISANVGATATLTFGSTSTAFTQYTWGSTSAPITDNTTQYLAAGNNSSATINASLRTSASNTGGGSIFFIAPNSTVAGTTSGNSIPLNTFAYDCSGNYTAAPTAQSTTNPAPTTITTQPKSAIVAGSNTACQLNFAAGASVASSSINLNLYMDDRNVPADTYSLSGFQVVVSAT